MDARVTLAPETVRNDSLKIRTMRYIAEHEDKCRNIKRKTLSEKLAEEFKTTYNSMSSTLSQLIARNAIMMTGSKTRGNYRVNLLHNWVTPEIRALANSNNKTEATEQAKKIINETKIEPQHKEEVIQVPVKINRHEDDKNKNMSIAITINLNI